MESLGLRYYILQTKNLCPESETLAPSVYTFIQMQFYSDSVILEALYWHLQAWSFYTQLKIVYWPNLLQMHLYSYNVNEVLTSASEAGIITVIAVVYTNSSVRTVYQL